MNKLLKNQMHRLICISAILMMALSVHAKDHEKYWNRFINVGFSSMSIEQGPLPKLSSDIGASFSVGTTYHLHKKPIANCMYIGLDATWIDLNYTNFKPEGDDQIHKAGIGMQLGPSITFNPVKRLNLRAYFRYAPTFSASYSDSGGDFEFDDLNCAYASMFVTGGTISYGFIGVGFEARFGSAKHEPILRNSYSNYNSSDKINTDFSGFRAYLSFRF